MQIRAGQQPNSYALQLTQQEADLLEWKGEAIEILEDIFTGQLGIIKHHRGDKRAARFEARYATMTPAERIAAKALFPDVDD